MDRGTFIWADHAARGGSAGGQFKIEVGKTETIYDWRISDCGHLSVNTRLDGGDSAPVCQGAGGGWWTQSCSIVVSSLC